MHHHIRTETGDNCVTETRQGSEGVPDWLRVHRLLVDDGAECLEPHGMAPRDVGRDQQDPRGQAPLVDSWTSETGDHTLTSAPGTESGHRRAVALAKAEFPPVKG